MSETKTCQRAAGLSYFSDLPKAKTEWGWLKGKFTNAAKVNLKEYNAKSQSTEQDDLQPLQLRLWALAAICYSLYLSILYFSVLQWEEYLSYVDTGTGT